MRITRVLPRIALVLACAGAAAGCALTSKSDSLVLRYFSPVTTPPRTTAAELNARPKTPPIAMRLGRVNAARYLRDKIAFRDSAYELGYYDDLRWTDKPETYVRHALRSALFEEGRAQQVVAGPGLTLDVDLDAFEEVKAEAHAGRVGVTWTLRDDRVVVAEESFVVERQFRSKGEADPSALVAALSGALDEAVARIVSRALQTAACGHGGCSPDPVR